MDKPPKLVVGIPQTRLRLVMLAQIAGKTRLDDNAGSKHFRIELR